MVTSRTDPVVTVLYGASATVYGSVMPLAARSLTVAGAISSRLSTSPPYSLATERDASRTTEEFDWYVGGRLMTAAVTPAAATVSNAAVSIGRRRQIRSNSRRFTSPP